MTLLSTAVRNAMLNAIEATIGTSPKLRIYGGPVPSAILDLEGVLLAEINLPSDWMSTASDGEKVKSGAWSTNSAIATGQATHYRIYGSSGSVAHEQGTISGPGGDGDMIINDVNVVASETVLVAAFTWTAGNE